MLYLVWYDEDIRRPMGEKVQNALAAYSKRFSIEGNLVLMNEVDVAKLEGTTVEVRSERTVQPHHFWVGRNDTHEAVDTAPERGMTNG
ncbi:MAG: hypothetical protein HGA19_07275 [Oscillochloris sp.]|nr:hypothetical protein [Oscillochloris sp.]